MTSRKLLTLLILVCMIWFRLAISFSFSTSSPDGDQYYALATSLLRDGRYAYGPPPAPLTYTRLPGYPIATALLDWKPRARDTHVQRAAVANAVLDTLSAGILAVWLIELTASLVAGWISVVAMAVSPLAILYSVAALSESLTTFLCVLQLFLLWRLALQGQRKVALIAGFVAGFSQLVRFDALTIAPLALYALYRSPGNCKRRGKLFILYILSAFLVFAPWPIRNVVRFGSPHPAATEWLAQDGSPLSTGLIKWLRTWCTGAQGESFLPDLIVFGHSFSANLPGVLLPQMYDSTEERQRISYLINRLGINRHDKEANDGFVQLAYERMRSKPLRTFIILPISRIKRLLMPQDPQTIRWVRIPLIDWPRKLIIFPVFYVISYSCAVLGMLSLGLRRRWLPLVILTLPIGTRLALYSIAVPHQAGPRYFVEAMPLVIALAIIGLMSFIKLILQFNSSQKNSHYNCVDNHGQRMNVPA